MPDRIVDQHLEAVGDAVQPELRDFGYPKVANAAALPILTAAHVGTIYTTIDDGANHRLKSSDGTTAEWVIWYEAGTVTPEDITGTYVLDVTGHEGADLQMVGDVTAISFTGWDPPATLPALNSEQTFRVRLIQDATGGRTFDWTGVDGVWVESPPDVFDSLPGDVSLHFLAWTLDGGTNVYLRPEGVTYAFGVGCPAESSVQRLLPAVAAGGETRVAHGFEWVSNVLLFDEATGVSDTPRFRHETPGDPSSPILIEFRNAGRNR